MSKKEETKMEEMEMEMEMELELDGSEVLDDDMKEVISETVKNERVRHQKEKSKRGPKKGSTNKKTENKPAKKKEPNYNDRSFIEREIKRGKISAPCFRIEKAEDGYDLLESKGIIFSGDAKYEKYDNTKKMVDGKWMIALRAKEILKSSTFKAKHEDGVDIEHDYVRAELHKPGRKKDVIELYRVSWAEKKEDEVNKKEEEKVQKEKEKAQKEKEEKAKVEPVNSGKIKTEGKKIEVKKQDTKKINAV